VLFCFTLTVKFGRPLSLTAAAHGEGIAELLEMGIGEVKDLVTRLPLSDEEIAQMLGLPNRQKAINLRHSAIKTIKRWMREI
jgi:predicted mannosyl-3-phosphoglycerate phosphatase (HAD superfamily)